MAKYRITPSSKAIIQLPISIGHKAEKGVEAIEFDLTAWVETYGSGTLTVIMRRWGDAIPYPIALEIDENNKATWTLSDTDTAKAGMAYAQLNYIVGDEVVKKSDIYTFRVMDSLTGEGEPPEAYESWLEHLTHFAAEAMAEVLDIEGIVTDKTLTVDGGIADGKATGDALALKADKSTTYTKTEVDQMIEDVEVETDTTLEITGAPADAAETGRQIGLLKADLGAQTETNVNYVWAQGSYAGVSGVPLNHTARIRYKPYNVEGLIKLKIANNYKAYLFAWDANGVYAGRLLSNYTLSLSVGYLFESEIDIKRFYNNYPNYKIAIVGTKSDTTELITPADGTNFTFVYVAYMHVNEVFTDKVNSIIDDTYNTRIATLPTKYLSIDTLLSCEKLLCVHHDNFHRSDSNEVGQNGTESVPMAYNILSNMDNIGIVTGISSNTLINSGGVEGEKKILSVDSGVIPYKITADIVSGFTGVIVVDVKNINNYISITFTENSIILGSTGNRVNSQTITHNAGITSLSCYVYNDKICVFAGGEVITVKCKIASSVCGMLFETGVSSKYTNFCVYQINKMLNDNYDGFIENASNISGLLGSLLLTQNNSCIIQNVITNSKKALKFNLDYDGTTVRSEIGPKTIREKLYPLTTCVYSFDVYFPNEYASDDLHDVFFQLHGSSDGIVPCLALKIEDDNICISVKGASNRITMDSTSYDIDHRQEVIICPLEKGKWLNFVLFYKAGYMSEHDPLTLLYIDGELEFISRLTNAYNEPLRAYPKYGIYKSGWGTAPSDVSSRTLYYDNIQIWE